MDNLYLREAQKKILQYRSGFLGVSAVPGSGKTWTLSRLAADLVLSEDLQPDQEILIVTFSNSAADNFSYRISNALSETGLLHDYGYRVRTLHGLANDIIRERPELAGLSNDFGIMDEKETDEILSEIVAARIQNHSAFFENLLIDTLNEKARKNLLKKELPQLLKTIARVFISNAKDQMVSPDTLNQLIQHFPSTNLFEICRNIYADYQAALNYRGAVDFSDLIRLALQCLRNDQNLVAELQHKWPYILEDEAQDSSQLQEQILQTLAGTQGNWVRVGDPNQAIYQSFTTANPNLLSEFISRKNVVSQDLPESGRSSNIIITLANSLNLWVQNDHPNLWVRDALSHPLIQPTKPGDSQQNPLDRPDSLSIVTTRFSPEEEADFLVNDIKKHLQTYPEETIAVLAFVNQRVTQISEKLKSNDIPVIDALMSLPEKTRLSAGAIANIIKTIHEPDSPLYLSKAFEVVHREKRDQPDHIDLVRHASALLRTCKNPEDFLYPDAIDWIQELIKNGEDQVTINYLQDFRSLVQRWHQSIYLPLDQIITLIAHDLTLDAFELATVHKLSNMLRSLRENHPDWNVHDFNQELIEIARNERRFFNFSENEEGFDPEKHKGKVTLATMHKAKGLEWDKVYLTSTNNYDYPSGNNDDIYISEKWYLKGQKNFEAEIIHELKTLLQIEEQQSIPSTLVNLFARNVLICERLRLLYVGITRAKKSLTITWNTGKKQKASMAIAIKALENRAQK